MLKTYQRVTETKLFEFLRNTNREELKDKTKSLFNGFTLQWLYFTMALCNGYVAFKTAVYIL